MPTLRRYFVHGAAYVDERAVMRDMTEGPTGTDYYYVLADLYTVDGLVNNRGREIERYTYDAYGKPMITTFRMGNVNYDANINTVDVGLLYAAYGTFPCSSAPAPRYDVNGDGGINSLDIGLVQANYGPAFQEDQPTSGVDNPYLFTGRPLDIFYDATDGIDLKLQDNRARTYNPQHGRWMQRDRIGYADGMNLYEYVRSTPVLAADPSGHKIFECKCDWDQPPFGCRFFGRYTGGTRRTGVYEEARHVVTSILGWRLPGSPCKVFTYCCAKCESVCGCRMCIYASTRSWLKTWTENCKGECVTNPLFNFCLGAWVGWGDAGYCDCSINTQGIPTGQPIGPTPRKVLWHAA